MDSRLSLTYLGMCGAEALRHLKERRPGALYHENFAEHVRQLPARRIRPEHL